MYNPDVTPEKSDCATANDSGSVSDRREVFQKLGRFAAYAAPITLLALTNKAQAASQGFGGGGGGGPHKKP
jgi:hypothetical protein